MNWWLKFFNRDCNKENSKQSASSVLQGQNFTSVLHVVAEETIMATAQWLVSAVKQFLDRRTLPPEPPIAPPTSEGTATTEPAIAIETLIPKVATLIEQLYDRTQSLLSLEQRMQVMEQSLANSQAVAATKQDTAQFETALQQVAQLSEQLQQESQTITLLHHRLTQLETVIEMYRSVPRLLEQQQRAIATLQARISELESPKNNHYYPIANHK